MRFVGLDLGTQSLKAVVCDEHLTVLGQHAVPYMTLLPAPDRAEQDPRVWEAALGPAIGGALAASGTKPADVAALAVVGQLDGCIAVDGHGAPVHPALIWQDRRAIAEAQRVSAEEVFAITGQVADASHMAPKICWLRDHGVRAERFHQPVSYLVMRLTGEHVIDPALASTTMLFDLDARTWSSVLLDGFAIAETELPLLLDACAVAGGLTASGAALTGLPTGTPVAVGTGDDFANVLGAGITAPGTIVCAIGTAEVVGALHELPLKDHWPGALVETHVFPSGGYFVEHPGWLAGGALRWAMQLLGVERDADFDALAASVPIGSTGLVFLPALAGQMVPRWDPNVRATLHGMTAATTRGEVARAVLEGLTFWTQETVTRLHGILGLWDRAGDPQEVLLVGGGARNRTWNGLRATALQRRHRVAANIDTCPIAAAMIASVCAGAHANLATAAQLLPAAGELFEPGPRDGLTQTYAAYWQLMTRLGRTGDV